MNAPLGNQSFDIVVIGGGISGLAIARQAAQSGIKVLLLEQQQLGAATSANSLRIIHGGFRYLQTLNIRRVVQSLKDQARVWREFPDLVRELPCYLPLKKFGLKSALPLTLARHFYRLLGMMVGVRVPPTGILSVRGALEKLSILEGQVPHGAFLWTDLQLLSPERLHERLAIQAAEAGAIISVNSKVIKVSDLGSHCVVAYQHSDKEHSIHAQIVVNATGPWANIPSVAGPRPLHAEISWCRAFNLVFKGNPFGVFGFALPAAEGRQYFVVGREGQIAVGTEYLPFSGDPAQISLTDRELDAFFERFKSRIPELNLSAERFLGAEVGILPVSSSGKVPEESLIGSAQLVNRGRIISLLSTKYTTFLSQADLVVAAVRDKLGK